MKHVFALLFCIGSILFASAQAPVTIDWEVSSTAGGGLNQPESIKRTLDGGYIVAGSNSGQQRVARFAADGMELWSGLYGGPGIPDIAFDVLVMLNGHFMVAGYVFGEGGQITGGNGGLDAWLIELDGSGQMIWQRCYGGSGADQIRSISHTGDGGLIMVGYSASSDGDVSVNQGGTDLWLVKLDAAYDIEWERTYGGSLDDQGTSVRQTADGGYIVAGHTRSNNGDVTGHHGEEDLWVLKVNATGAIEWQRALGGSSNDFNGGQVIQVNDGGYVVATTSMSSDGDVTTNHGEFDYWVVKLDALGEIVWQYSYGGPGSEYFKGLASTLDGGIILTGSTNEAGGHISNYHGGLRDAWVVKLNGAGQMEWQRTFGGSLMDQGMTIIQDPDGSYVMACRSNSIDGDASSNSPAGDFWIVKFTSFNNFITGRVYADLNSNGIFDDGDVPIHNHIIQGADGNNLTFTHTNGEYMYMAAADAQVTLQPAAITYYDPLPATHSHTFIGVNEIVADKDFAFQPAGSLTDLMVTLSPITAFRPGFPAHLELRCRNIGTTTVANSSMTYWNSIPLYFTGTTPMAMSWDPIWWNIPELPPFGEFIVTIHVEVPSSVELGTVIEPHAVLFVTDEDASNNISFASITVKGSYDPNDIQVDREVLQLDELAGQPRLDYLIRFQNTGTDTAFTVKIRNPLPGGVDLSTFEFIGASHHVQLQHAPAEDLLWFHFDNILLPDSNTNEALSHGYVRYKIAPRTDLNVGDLIENQVGIYFDFNAPIITNVATTEITTTTAIAELPTDRQLLIHPNPTSGNIQFQLDLENAALTQVGLFTSTGQLVRSIPIGSLPSGRNSFTLPAHDLPTGIYHVRIQVGDEMVKRKVVKL